jgi:uncharacterized glyoxalase superfamily protein PhnB
MSIHPTFLYRDAAAAIDFLECAFGFETKERHDNPDGTVAHSELDSEGLHWHFGTYVPQAAAATPESA